MASPFVEIEVDNRVVKVTNPDRVYFPESGEAATIPGARTVARSPPRARTRMAR